jgi:FHA domain-containing protein
MLTLRVTSVNGQAPAQPIEATFDAAGGTIGRADDNRLVLPDPTRHVSRLHARVAFKGGGFELIDQGGNPIDVNGVPVGRGHAARLRLGDLIRIGGYAISVVGASPADAPAGAWAAPVRDDPLAAFGTPSATDPLGLGFGGSASSSTPPPAAAGRASAAGGIPDDFDPFADPMAARQAAVTAPARLPDDFDLGLGGPGGTAPSIDAAFGLAPASGADPFAAGPLSKPVAQGGSPAPPSLDPLAPWRIAAPVPTAAPVPDRVPEIHGSFKPPLARPERVPSAAPPVPLARPSADRPLPPAPPVGHDSLLSMFDDAAAASAPATDPLGLGAAAAAPPRNASTDVVTKMPMVDRSPTQSSTSVPAPAPPAESRQTTVPTASRDALTQAFLAGLGATQLPLTQITPETMERIGRLLREATQGTLDLLTARALTKREVRAEATMIVGKDNNPLKFSPGVDAALGHLLAPRGQGFMPPEEAMRDAYDDLRAHQFGFMAGLRAALAGMLRRFDPAVLEQRLAHKSVLDSLVPMNRRGKLWDLYGQLYREIASEAEDDFHTLFGREFLRAYEEQIARLDRASDE